MCRNNHRSAEFTAPIESMLLYTLKVELTSTDYCNIIYDNYIKYQL